MEAKSFVLIDVKRKSELRWKEKIDGRICFSCLASMSWIMAAGLIVNAAMGVRISREQTETEGFDEQFFLLFLFLLRVGWPS